MNKPRTAIYLGWADTEVSYGLEELLAAHFVLKAVRHNRFGEKLDQEALASLRADFLFSFGPLIVRQPLLRSLAVAPVNFHTAPPKWPGRGSCSYALYDGDTEFGVTAHLMTPEIDAGPILRVLRFPIAADDTAESLHAKTLQKIPELAAQVLAELERNDWQPRVIDESWAGRARPIAELRDLMLISERDTDEEVRRKVRAFSHSAKPGPFIERAGYRFWYSKSSTPAGGRI